MHSPLQSGKPPREIRVHVPQDPWFHPRDSPHLVNRFKLQEDTYFEFYDWRKNKWLEGGFHSVPVHVDLSGELHYRSQGVTWSTDMPGSTPPPAVTASYHPPPMDGGPSLLSAVAAEVLDTSGLQTPSAVALGKRPDGPLIDLTVDDDAM